jgi:hypothetical protein
VSQNQGERVPSRHTIERKSNIGVTNAAAGDFDDNLIGTGGKVRDLARLEGGTRSLQLEPISALNAGHWELLSNAEAIAMVEAR